MTFPVRIYGIGNVKCPVQSEPFQVDLKPDCVSITERGQGYGLVAPDKISIFRQPIMDKCRQENIDIAAEIGAVVRHEIAHHFGISDERLDEIERERGI